jgi:TRAP-type C4-dicarboxylate transport system substrate-binding protein
MARSYGSWCSAAMLTLSLVAVSGAADSRTFRLGHVFEPHHPFHVAATMAAEHFHACTGGAHSIDLYPSSQLGSDNELQDQIQIGAVDATLASFIFAAANHYPPLAIGAAPFMFRDRDHALRYMESDLFKEAWRGWMDATGAHILSAAFFGFYNVTAKTRIEKPEDIRGMRVRVPNMPIFLAFPEAVGASPTPIPLHEVYLALQQGVAEGSVNGLSMTYAHRFYEVQDYVNQTHHMVDFTLWVSADVMVQALDDAGRACLQEAADLWGREGSRLLYELEEGLRAELEGAGHVEFVSPDRDAFRAMTEGAIDQFAQMLGVPIETAHAIRDM